LPSVAVIIMKHTVVKGNLVDVVGGMVFPAQVTMIDGKIWSVERSNASYDRYLVPGFIDAHIHIESSLLTPSRFAEAAVPHGTTATVSDPHEIANVLGTEGVRYMVKDAEGVPLRIRYTAPSCVPATSWETSGAKLGWREVRELLRMKEFVALGEVMNVPGVLADDPEVMAKIEVAQQMGKPVDGHCPEVIGDRLDRYISAGISTDHECISAKEAEEKHRKGMLILVREGSSSKNLAALMPFAKAHSCCLISDDLQATDLQKGHLDLLLRKAVALGMEPVHALRAVTMWPAAHYRLPGGHLSEGEVADLVVLRDLKNFQVLQVYIGGDLVAEDGLPKFQAHPQVLRTGIRPPGKETEAFVIHARSQTGRAKVRVIGMLGDQDISKAEEAVLPIVDGQIKSDPGQDVLLMAVVNRYAIAPPALAFARGLGLKKGAIASTVAHDSHNIIAVGVDVASLALAVMGVAESGGYFATDGQESVALPLRVAGLMSSEPCAAVAAGEERMMSFVRALSCTLPAPFMTLSFQSLLVEPELKLSDKGLFDSVRFRFVDAVV